MKIGALAWSFVAAAGLVHCGGSSSGGGASRSSERVGIAASALSADQCQYFETNGRTTICHATGSATNPYVLIKVSESACVNAHANHPSDFVDVNGGNCNGAACLPETAPCDPTLPCCGNLSCTDGTCQCPPGQSFCEGAATCVDTTSDPSNCGGCGVVCATGICTGGACVSPCVAVDSCHVAGTFDPATGACSNPAQPEGTPCNPILGFACHNGFCGPSAPTILEPVNNEMFASEDVAFSGVGSPLASVTITDFGVFVQYSQCNFGGAFSGTLLLAPGQHSLSFAVAVGTGEPGPGSDPITVTVTGP
jgi:hypothetical protein